MTASLTLGCVGRSAGQRQHLERGHAVAIVLHHESARMIHRSHHVNDSCAGHGDDIAAKHGNVEPRIARFQKVAQVNGKGLGSRNRRIVTRSRCICSLLKRPETGA